MPVTLELYLKYLPPTADLVLLSAATRAGVIAAYLFPRHLRRGMCVLVPGRGYPGHGRGHRLLEGRLTGRLLGAGCFLPGNIDMEYGMCDIVPDGGGEGLELLVAFAPVSVYGTYLA